MTLLLWVADHPFVAALALIVCAVVLTGLVFLVVQCVVGPLYRFVWPRARHRRTVASRLRERRALRLVPAGDPHPDVPAPRPVVLPPLPDSPPSVHDADTAELVVINPDVQEYAA